MIKPCLFFVVCFALAGCVESVHYYPHSHPHSHPELEPVIMGNPDAGDEFPGDLAAGVTSGPIVYCKQCGVMPGKVSSCPRYSSHNFDSAVAGLKVICKQCGVYPSKVSTQCPRYSSHSFITIRPDITLICQHCGGAPTGKPTQCPRYSSHKFKEFK